MIYASFKYSNFHLFLNYNIQNYILKSFYVILDT